MVAAGRSDSGSDTTAEPTKTSTTNSRNHKPSYDRRPTDPDTAPPPHSMLRTTDGVSKSQPVRPDVDHRDEARGSVDELQDDGDCRLRSVVVGIDTTRRSATQTARPPQPRRTASSQPAPSSQPRPGQRTPVQTTRSVQLPRSVALVARVLSRWSLVVPSSTAKA